MSDAQAAPVTKNGVPPAAHEYVIEEAPTFKVFVGNLAYSTTDEGLETFFAPVKSDIIAKQVIMRGHKAAGYGFVTMSSAEAAQKAVELLDTQELDGRQVVVQIAKPAEQKDKEKKAKRRPNRRGAKTVPGEVTDAEANGDVKIEDTAAAAAAAALGTDEAAKPKRKKKKYSRRFNRKASAPVEATETLETEEASNTVPTPAPATKRQPRRRFRSRPVGEAPDGEPSKNMLFVANLGFNVDDESLSKLFTDAGINVVSARVVRRRWGNPRRSKGYGFVDVGSEEEQTRAMATLQGMEVGGRSIVVKVAVNSTSALQEVDSDAAA